MKTALKKLVKPTVVSLASRFGPHRRNSSEPRLWILMYHRILPPTDERFHMEEPGMRVTPESFDMHLEELKRHFDIVSLGDWMAARAAGEPLPRRACAVTFDDGWQDNYDYAFPLLKKHQVPATLFAVAEKIGTDFQFWPNIIAAILLNGGGPRLAAHPVLAPAGTEQARPSANDIAESIKRLKVHSEAEVFSALEEVSWRSLCGAMPKALMGWDELREMQNSGLVTVGSHTCTHQRLTSTLSQDALSCEVVHSRRVLEEQIGEVADLFCFPNGDYNTEALELVQTHYRAAVTTRRGINDSGTLQPHELTRIGMHDDISCTRRLFNARLSGWV